MKAVADLRKWPNWGREKVVNGMKAVNIISVNLQWLIFKKLEILGGFLQVHVSKSPMADLKKSVNLGGCMLNTLSQKHYLSFRLPIIKCFYDTSSIK